MALGRLVRRLYWTVALVALSPVMVHAQDYQALGSPAPQISQIPQVAQNLFSALRAEAVAKKAGLLFDPVYPRMPVPPPDVNLHGGMQFEMSLAPPVANMPTDPYELAKYGRLTMEYRDCAELDGNRYGVAARALHVAHHLLLYSFGMTTDINGDGMFQLSAGVAHYQTGNSREEPFVNAPFMRIKFQSSEEQLFAYSELEATMNARAYISGAAGLGIRVTPLLRLIGGFQHTEFLMPTEQLLRVVDGLEGTVQWGM